jgi:hypothetical protein
LRLASRAAGAALLLAAFQLPSASAASSQPAVPNLIPVNPGPLGYFQPTVPAGGTAAGSVTVANPSSQSATFDVYPVDGLTSDATGVVYSELGAALEATGTWIHLSTTAVTLPPGGSEKVNFTVDVPATAFPGDHVGGIAAENPSPSSEGASGGHGTGVALKVNTRVVVAVVVTVPGPAGVDIRLGTPAIEAQNGQRQVVALPMHDVGGLLSKPFLTAGVSPCSGGAALATLSRQLDTFVPHTSIVYEWPLAPRVLPAGCYRVSASLSDHGRPLSNVSSPVQVSQAVARLTPTVVGPRRAGTPSARGGSSRVGFDAAAAGAAVCLGLSALYLFLFWRRRRKEEEEQQPLPAAR